MSTLPLPGEFIVHDYRSEAARQKYLEDAKSKSEVRVVQWNIERGYMLPQIIEELKKNDADIICLQEIDIECERSAGANVGEEIARALQLNYVFVCEFVEIHSPIRPPRTQGGGIHGNGLLTKFDISSHFSIDHVHQLINWEVEGGPRFKEPRKGRRIEPGAIIKHPNSNVGNLLVYSVHLEIFTGIIGRVSQFSEVMRDAKQRVQENKSIDHVVICGDLNTIGHSIARLGKTICTDKLRFGPSTLFLTEAQWWQKYVFNQQEGEFNHKLKSLGVDDSVSASVVNTLCLSDPFDKYYDVTLTNYRNWLQGKLDWVLLDPSATVTHKEILNRDYTKSDHRLLLVDIKYSSSHTVHDPSKRDTRSRVTRANTTNALLTLAASALITLIASGVKLFL
jgi:endonuclease/exonuclease/phosphatase family metal-dependent hydrolase